MTRSKLIWSTLILAVGTAASAWAQPPRDGDRDARDHAVYNQVWRQGDRDDVYRGGRWGIFRNDHDRDDRVRRGDRDDVYRHRGWDVRDRDRRDHDHDGDRH